MAENAVIIVAVAAGFFLLGFLAAMILFGYLKTFGMTIPGYKYQWDDKGNLIGVYPLRMP